MAGFRGRARPARDHTEDEEHAKVVSLDEGIRLKSPVVLAGFPDNGMVGSICMNHVIEQMGMHQVAFIDSQYIMASALYVGKKLRHPFRIYSNGAGTVCALICEVPILARGVRPVVNSIIDWFYQQGVQDITVMGGISPTNISPPFSAPRSAYVLQNMEDAEAAGVLGEMQPAGARQGKVKVPTSAFVVGIGGALLSSCVANGIKCRGLFVPSLGEAPDPGGAAILLEALAAIVPKAKVDTESLRAEAEMIKKQLEELLKMQQKQMAEYERAEERPETERIYK
jgi:uncharacterized protein